MWKTVQAIYENGVLRPLEPVELTDQQEVTVTISPDGDIPDNHPLLVPASRWARDDDDGPVPTLEEVYKATSRIRGSLSDAIIEQRQDR